MSEREEFLQIYCAALTGYLAAGARWRDLRQMEGVINDVALTAVQAHGKFMALRKEPDEDLGASTWPGKIGTITYDPKNPMGEKLAQVVLPQEKFERPLAETMEAEKRAKSAAERAKAYRERKKAGK